MCKATWLCYYQYVLAGEIFETKEKKLVRSRESSVFLRCCFYQNCLISLPNLMVSKDSRNIASKTTNRIVFIYNTIFKTNSNYLIRYIWYFQNLPPIRIRVSWVFEIVTRNKPVENVTYTWCRRDFSQPWTRELMWKKNFLIWTGPRQPREPSTL